eukprot:350724-Chlamydomonas_euryale.AAC.2
MLQPAGRHDCSSSSTSRHSCMARVEVFPIYHSQHRRTAAPIHCGGCPTRQSPRTCSRDRYRRPDAMAAACVPPAAMASAHARPAAKAAASALDVMAAACVPPAAMAAAHARPAAKAAASALDVMAAACVRPAAAAAAPFADARRLGQPARRQGLYTAAPRRVPRAPGWVPRAVRVPAGGCTAWHGMARQSISTIIQAADGVQQRMSHRCMAVCGISVPWPSCPDGIGHETCATPHLFK